MNIKYKINKELLFIQAIASFLPLSVFTYMLFHVGRNSEILYLLFLWAVLAALFLTAASFYFLYQRLWEKDYLYTRNDTIYFYDCLKGKYIGVKIEDVAGLNDYHISVYPYTFIIIYTVAGKFTHVRT